MSTGTPHTTEIAAVFLALGGVLLLTIAPFELGAIRLAGVSLLWWYGGLAVPAVAVTVTAAALARGGAREADGVTPASPPAGDTL